MSKNTKIQFLFLLVAIMGFVVAKPAKAITVSPVKSELKANPGETLEETIQLYNNQKESRIFYIDFQSFESRDETGNPMLLKSKVGLPSWMSSEDNVIALGANERKNVKIKVAVPPDAEPGGYFAATIFTNEPPKTTDEEGTVGLSSQVGSLLLLNVSGDLSEKGNILEFNTKTKKRLFKNLPIDFYYRFQNNGATWSKPVGDITIENIWGGTSKIIPANPEGGNVLPSSIRKMEASWITKKGQTEDPKAERLVLPEKFWDKVKFEAKNSPTGRFNARLTLNFGAGNQLRESKEIVLWILPWELLSIAIPAAILLIILLIFSVKRYNRYIINKNARPKKRVTRTIKKISE